MSSKRLQLARARLCFRRFSDIFGHRSESPQSTQVHMRKSNSGNTSYRRHGLALTVRHAICGKRLSEKSENIIERYVFLQSVCGLLVSIRWHWIAIRSIHIHHTNARRFPRLLAESNENGTEKNRSNRKLFSFDPLADFCLMWSKFRHYLRNGLQDL